MKLSRRQLRKLISRYLINELKLKSKAETDQHSLKIKEQDEMIKNLHNLWNLGRAPDENLKQAISLMPAIGIHDVADAWPTDIAFLYSPNLIKKYMRITYDSPQVADGVMRFIQQTPALEGLVSTSKPPFAETHGWKKFNSNSIQIQLPDMDWQDNSVRQKAIKKLHSGSPPDQSMSTPEILKLLSVIGGTTLWWTKGMRILRNREYAGPLPSPWHGHFHFDFNPKKYGKTKSGPSDPIGTRRIYEPYPVDYSTLVRGDF